MAGRRGGRTKLVRRLQVAARYPGIGIGIGIGIGTLVLVLGLVTWYWYWDWDWYPGIGMLWLPRYPGNGLLWLPTYLGIIHLEIIHLGIIHRTLFLGCFGCPRTWESGSIQFPCFEVLYVPGVLGVFIGVLK